MFQLQESVEISVKMLNNYLFEGSRKGIEKDMSELVWLASKWFGTIANRKSSFLISKFD